MLAQKGCEIDSCSQIQKAGLPILVIYPDAGLTGCTWINDQFCSFTTQFCHFPIHLLLEPVGNRKVNFLPEEHRGEMKKYQGGIV